MLSQDKLTDGYERLRLRYESDLRSYCRMLTGTPWDAEDLYQETMLKALRASESFLRHPAPRAFLFRVASNAWMDECRKRKADVGLPDGHEALVSEPDVDAFDVEAALERLVSAVPPYQAAVYLLADVFDYRAREIASMLETTEGAAKAALHRARKRLAAIAKDAANERDGAFAVQGSGHNQQGLIRRFLEAFRCREPMAVAAAYRRLAQAGIRAERLLLQGKLHFTFRDPEGNAFTIRAE